MDPPVGGRVYYQDGERGREYGRKSDEKSLMPEFKVPQKRPYQGGYRVFAPGPLADVLVPTDSMFDDIVNYWRYLRPSEDPKDSFPVDNPLKSANYAKKVVAAMWINALEYIRKSVVIQECALEDKAVMMRRPSPKEDEDKKILQWLNFATSHAYTLKRRCLQFSDDMQDNMTELGEKDALKLRRLQSSDDMEDNMMELGEKDAQDWIYIRNKLVMWTHRSRVLMNAISDLKNWKILEVGERKAESTLFIQNLGTIYLPLSLTAGLLSMVDNFSPGRSHFWIYFVVSLPLMLLSFAFISLWPRLWERVESLWERVKKNRESLWEWVKENRESWLRILKSRIKRGRKADSEHGEASQMAPKGQVARTEEQMCQKVGCLSTASPACD